jgi:hypothetical protein
MDLLYLIRYKHFHVLTNHFIFCLRTEQLQELLTYSGYLSRFQGVIYIRI